MRRILLSSSQVSILLSGFIIISCTAALFLSGYVIQQRTLRELRAAIRPRQPRQKPQMYLPDHFKTSTQLLEDGRVLQIESQAEREEREQKISLVEVEQTIGDDHHKKQSGVAVPSEKVAMLEKLQASVTDKSWAVEHPDPMVKSKVPISRAERRRLIKEEIQRLSQSEEQVYYQRRLW